MYVCMYVNLMTPTFVDRVGSKNKSIGMYFQSTTKLTAPQYPVRSRRIARAEEKLDLRI